MPHSISPHTSMPSVTTSPPLPDGTEEQNFDKRKKHLWVSDHPEDEPEMQGRHRSYQCTASGDWDYRDRSRALAPGDSPAQAKARAEVLERTLKSSRRNKDASLYLPSEMCASTQGGASTLPKSWKPGDPSNARTIPHDRIHSPQPNHNEPLRHGDNHRPGSSYPPSLSVFNSPTATYMWPSFQAASQMSHRPLIYVNYNKESPNPSSTASTPPREPVPPRTPPRALSRHDHHLPASIPQKRSPSPDLEYVTFNQPKSSLYNNVYFRYRNPPASTLNRIIEPLNRIQISRGDSQSPSYLQSSRYGPGGPAAQSNSRHDDPPPNKRINSSPRSDWHSHEELNDSSPPSDTTSESSAVPPTTRRTSPKSEGGGEWEQYAHQTLSFNGSGRKWLCTWVVTDSGRPVTCNYTSKKQLVKRHVETTHLKYKPYVCSVCAKGFPQKTSLDTHMHGHTGSTPHECRYGCGMSFKDPARRHRHMVEEHGYVPRQSKRKHKVGQQPEDPSDFESVRPWDLEGSSKT
ncbi:hypothetical protein SERLA73DRAFT_190204 [Serpula lacrymans var. lacrymans S7.3]|uniref:C2H2-type domain-containing protein n=2 Tax=Serpula lacrymans var. lacrymans TaxID=341189 RepID=F8QF93_SERL3|nr:uncharacterized protein SERLADRAFT_462093 [Serpula lacrymans var. lacrymans S7.9]EGN93052.1 hypothetical protein SERLA73DRAFT_190204 [Serpula lacrymans var. lacrymans S7.3]EGO27889.1 hypothetical protein SERLADRAFT_462093 [Serpula lacrymans var. lacrymans S7.9]